MGEIKQFRLPDVGEGLTEAEILSWLVRPGDQVKVNQPVVEIETAKSAVELPCPFEGTVAGLLVDEGVTVDVGTPIIGIDVAGGQVASQPLDANGAAVAEGTNGAAPRREPNLVGYGVSEGSTVRRRRRQPAPPPAVTPPPKAEPTAAPAARGTVKALAKPPVRKLAKDLGVDLATVVPTGTGGVITREDVRRAADREVRGAPAATGVGDRRIPIRSVRKATAAAVVSSAFTAPHVTEFLTIDMTRSMRLLERLRLLPEFAEVRVSPLLLVAKALLIAVRRNPEINAHWDGDAGEIVVHEHVNLGIAAATERGLIVPNIKSAESLPLPGLATALVELATTAKAGRTPPADLVGGTITITNVGVFGVDTGTPILNPGEAAILAFGAVREQPWVHKGKVKPRQVTTLGLSFDHRLVDGELGSKVLRDVGAVLTDPLTALAWS